MPCLDLQDLVHLGTLTPRRFIESSFSPPEIPRRPRRGLLFHSRNTNILSALPPSSSAPLCCPPHERERPRHEMKAVASTSLIISRSSRGRKWGKGIHPRVDEAQGFQYLGHSNWTIGSLLSWFCFKKIPPFIPSYWEVQFFITPERVRKEAAVAENGEKGFTQK